MEAICSSETSVDTQQTTRRYIPEDGTLHNHRCENLKFYFTCVSGVRDIYILMQFQIICYLWLYYYFTAYLSYIFYSYAWFYDNEYDCVYKLRDDF
jgi:hypothetical protein